MFLINPRRRLLPRSDSHVLPSIRSLFGGGATLRGACRRFIQSRKNFIKYGVNVEDTWNLDYSMIELLYERLVLYKKVTNADLEKNFVEVDGVSRSMGNVIDEVLYRSRMVLDSDAFWAEDEEELLNQVRRVWEIWSVLSPHVWW